MHDSRIFTIVVTVNPSPNVSGGNNQSICIGSPVTLSGSGATNYTWNNGVVNGATLTTDRNGIDNNTYSFDGLTNEILVSDIIIDGNTYTTKDWLPEINDYKWHISCVGHCKIKNNISFE
jgi:hypothetical protein